jgi:hypothetical protein
VGHPCIFKKETAKGYLRDMENVTETYILRDTVDPENRGVILTPQALPGRVEWPSGHYRYYIYM